MRENIRCQNAAPTEPGELNYKITTDIISYLKWKYDKVGYAQLNEVVGVLECAKQEFIRRMVNPYEDAKIKENGDVYGM